MKKLLILISLLLPITVSADNTVDNQIPVEEKFVTIFEDDIKTEKDVKGSSLLAGNNVISNNYVDGINMLLGNNVEHKGISEYTLMLGNVVNVSGNIKKDGFIFGNIITINEDFYADRDLTIFGSTVNISGSIDRDVIIYASSVKLENVEILGNVTIYATTLEVKGVSINGILSYNEDIEKIISDDSLITETKLLERLVKPITFKEQIYSLFISYASTMVLFLALAFVISNLFKKVENITENIKLPQIFSLLGYGALLLIGIPMVLIMLFTTVIGTSLSLIGLLVYIIAVCLSTILTGYFIGYLIWKKFVKKENNVLLIGLIGITFITILQLVPIIGEYVAILSMMAGLGIILKLLKK